MPTFSLLEKSFVDKNLTLLFNQYESAGTISEKNLYLKECTEKLINQKGGLDDFENWRLKAFAQVSGISGFGIQGRPNRTVRAKFRDQEGNVVEKDIPDLSSREIVDFAGWNQPQYLLYNLYFLTELYINIKIKKMDVSKELSNCFNPEALLAVLKEEIWITLNAYNIRTTYSLILGLRKDEYEYEEEDQTKNEQLDKFISDLLSDFLSYGNNETKMKDSKKILELCFPCGSKTHAIYITFIYYMKIESKPGKPGRPSKLAIRIDDSSPARSEKPHILAMLLPDLEPELIDTLKCYLRDVCNQLRSIELGGTEDIIYNWSNSYPFPKVDERKNDFPARKKQKAENCVVEGFRLGLYYRIQRCFNPHINDDHTANIIFNWIICLDKQFAAISHRDPGFFEESLLSTVINELPISDDPRIKIIDEYKQASNKKYAFSERLTLTQYLSEKRENNYLLRKNGETIPSFGKIQLVRRDLQHLDFSNGDFSEANFSYSKMKGIRFFNTDLSNADITNCKNLDFKALAQAKSIKDIKVGNEDTKDNERIVLDAINFRKLIDLVNSIEQEPEEKIKDMLLKMFASQFQDFLWKERMFVHSQKKITI